MPDLRPSITQSSWPIVGHEWIVEYLQRVVGTENAGEHLDARGLRHAYLFVGPPQVGKTTTVQAFAQALLCTGDADGGRRPCGKCRACQLMANGQHPDFRLVQPVDAEGNVDRANGSLRVHQAGELVREAALRPVEGRYKIFLIQDAHLAQQEFSNKILKTLEEPPDSVVICVTATDRIALLPTIVSRCEVLEFRPVSVDTAKDALTDRWGVEPERAELLARLSNGRFGWAVRQLEDATGAARRMETLEELWRLVAANRIERLRFAQERAANRDNLRLFSMLELWVTWWRDVLLAQHGCIDAISNLDQRAEIERQANELSAASVQRHLETLQRVERYLHHTVNTRLALDTLLLDIPQIAA